MRELQCELWPWELSGAASCAIAVAVLANRIISPPSFPSSFPPLSPSFSELSARRSGRWRTAELQPPVRDLTGTCRSTQSHRESRDALGGMDVHCEETKRDFRLSITRPASDWWSSGWRTRRRRALVGAARTLRCALKRCHVLSVDISAFPRRGRFCNAPFELLGKLGDSDAYHSAPNGALGLFEGSIALNYFH